MYQSYSLILFYFSSCMTNKLIYKWTKGGGNQTSNNLNKTSECFKIWGWGMRDISSFSSWEIPIEGDNPCWRTQRIQGMEMTLNDWQSLQRVESGMLAVSLHTLHDIHHTYTHTRWGASPPEINCSHMCRFALESGNWT